MILNRIVLVAMLFSSYGIVSAQGTPVPETEEEDVVVTTGLTSQAPTNKRDQPSMLEVGITPYYAGQTGDVDGQFGYGGALHLRKSLDHLFSLRFDGDYAFSKGDNEESLNENNRRYETSWLSGTGYGVVTMNNFTFLGDIRDWNLFLMAGAGANFAATEFQCNETTRRFGCTPGQAASGWNEDRNGQIDRKFRTHASFGAGINRRLSERFNIGVEYKAFIQFGNQADLLDGYAASTFRDVLHTVGVALNFNLGNPETHTEPRYWTNAFTPVKEDIASLNNRVDAATNDADNDGIVDAVDQDPNTPEGATVDSRGRTLDSDGDGVADYLDKEPFFPPREGEEIDADGVVIERIDAPLSEEEVQGMIDNSVNSLRTDMDNSNRTRINMEGGAIYLPMITFPLNQSDVKYDDYGVLASIARVMNANPDMTLVVRGYTDSTGDPEYNQRLSYRRALNVINHLVNNNGIARDRLILQYRGEDEAIVPLDRSRVNRRVEFLTGLGDDASQDDPPAGVEPETENGGGN